MCRFFREGGVMKSLFDLGSRVGVEWWVGWLANSTIVLTRFSFVRLFQLLKILEKVIMIRGLEKVGVEKIKKDKNY